jgi:hypothetical protein
MDAERESAEFHLVNNFFYILGFDVKKNLAKFNSSYIFFHSNMHGTLPSCLKKEMS